MSDTVIVGIISIIAPIVAGLISYFSARHQANTELKKVKEQQELEMQRIKEQHESQLQLFKEQSKHDLEKLKFEMERQIAVYDETKKTDLAYDVMGRVMSGDMSAFGNMGKALEETEKLTGQMKKMQSKVNHPGNRRR